MIMHKISEEQTTIAFRKRLGDSTLIDDTDRKFTIIPNSKRYRYSTPFLFDYGSDTYVFAECYDKLFFHTSIAYCKFKNGMPGEWHIVLKRPYDLSSPCVFGFRNNIYMIPGSSDIDNIHLYKASSFPNEWISVKNLVDNHPSSISTFYPFQNKHYILAYNTSTGILNNFSSGSLFDLLPPLPNKKLADPVQGADPGSIEYKKYMTRADIEDKFKEKHINYDLFAISPIPLSAEHSKNACPAGTPFLFANNTIRPARRSVSSCKSSGSLSFYKICDITPTIFEEELIENISPDKIKINAGEHFSSISFYNLSSRYEIVGLSNIKSIPNSVIRNLYKRSVRSLAFILDFPGGNSNDK